MSIRRRLDKLDADLHGGTVARQFATHVAGLSNEELQAEVDQEVRSLRHQGGHPSPPHPRGCRCFPCEWSRRQYAHVSDQELIEQTEALAKLIREKNAREGTTPPSRYMGR